MFDDIYGAVNMILSSRVCSFQFSNLIVFLIVLPKSNKNFKNKCVHTVKMQSVCVKKNNDQSDFYYQLLYVNSSTLAKHGLVKFHILDSLLQNC